MIEYKVTRTNPVTGEESSDYELFTDTEAAKQFADLHPEATVDFDGGINWAHSEDKYEHEV